MLQWERKKNDANVGERLKALVQIYWAIIMPVYRTFAHVMNKTRNCFLLGRQLNHWKRCEYITQQEATQNLFSTNLLVPLVLSRNTSRYFNIIQIWNVLPSERSNFCCVSADVLCLFFGSISEWIPWRGLLHDGPGTRGCDTKYQPLPLRNRPRCCKYWYLFSKQCHCMFIFIDFICSWQYFKEAVSP